MTLKIQQFMENNRQEWDDFVTHHSQGRFSQLIGYKDVIEKTYGYEASYWLFRGSGNKIMAIFPSFVKRSWLLGSKLVSQPFCEYGGLLGDGLSKADSSEIKHKLSDLVMQYRVPFLEIHGGTGLPQNEMERIFQKKYLHQYAVLKLTSPDEVWGKMDRIVRKAVRKAERSDLECYQETTEQSISNGFYPLYLRSMKKFGTPPLPLSFFLNCLRYLPEYMKLFLVKFEAKVIAALLGFTTGNRVHIVATTSGTRYLDKRPNDLAHWEFVKWATESSYEFFDFGPVRYAGQRQFKEKWGVEFHDYSYFFLPHGDKSKKVLSYSGSAQFLAFLWRRLVPLPLTGIIGPWFRKQLGD